MTTAGTGGVPTAGMSGGASGTPGTPGFVMCGGEPKDGVCKPMTSGIYGMKMEIDAWFMDEVNTSRPLFDPGRGKVTIYFRGALSEVCEDGSTGKGVMEPCGVRLPPLYLDINAGVVQIEFPDDLWEKEGVPDYVTTGSTTGFNVGDTLTIAKTTGLIGMNLLSSDAPWPTYTETPSFACADGKVGSACFPDMDGDGHPGITVAIKTTGTPPLPPYAPGTGDDWKYIAAPTSLLAGAFGNGATKVFVGVRIRVGGSGKIGADCMSGAGTAEAQDFESRSIDCLRQDGSPCTPAEAVFIDQNNPLYHVLQAGQMPPAKWKHARPEADMTLDRSASKGPVASVVRLGGSDATPSCAEVRDAAYVPFP